MYRVLIVDDERMIRVGMEKAINWEKAGISQVFTTGSAREALKLLKQETIQIMITDIQMGEMSGLELIEQVKKAYPHIRIIVLTGYDEFDYAQKCLKMKVEDFLLKPADEETMVQLISRQVCELKEEHKRKRMDKVMRRVMGSIEQVQLNQTMCRLLEEQSDQIVEEFCGRYPYRAEQRLQVAILLPLFTEETDEEAEYRALSIQDFCNQNIDLRERGITFLDRQKRIVLVCFLREENEDASAWMEELIGLLKGEFGIVQKIVLGSVVSRFSQMRISYNDAVLLMESKQKGYRELIQDSQRRDKNRIFWEVFREIKSTMASDQGNERSIMRAYDSFCQMTQSYGLPVEQVRRCCVEVAALAYYTHVANHRETKDEGMHGLMEAILSARKEDVLEITKAFIEQLHHSEEEKNHDLVEQAKDYIRDHLSEELSVMGIAQMFFLTPSYFSRLFKKIAHQRCNDYIVRLRMEKAQYLLESTNLKTGEIAVMVGYQDKNYFSLAFKKHAGVSPTAYRENCRLM